MQTYNSTLSRNQILAAQEMLEAAEPITVLGDFGVTKEMPKNSTDTLVFRRVQPFGAIQTTGAYSGTPRVNPGDFVLSEGVTPTPRTITYVDVPVQLQHWGVLFKFSSKAENLYEDNIPSDMTKVCGEAMAELLELVRYGVLRGGTNVLYSNGSSRTDVTTPISLNAIRRAARVLEANRGRRVTQMIAPGPNYATRAVAPAYIVFAHTDLIADFRNLAGFTRVEEYGSFKPIHPREIGAVEEFRIVTSPLFSPFLQAGGVAAANTVLSNGAPNTGSNNSDVYPVLVVASDAWGQVALRGYRSIRPHVLSANNVNHANPMGQFGYVGASTWFNCVRLNESWMLRIECAASALV